MIYYIDREEQLKLDLERLELLKKKKEKAPTEESIQSKIDSLGMLKKDIQTLEIFLGVFEDNKDFTELDNNYRYKMHNIPSATVEEVDEVEGSVSATSSQLSQKRKLLETNSQNFSRKFENSTGKPVQPLV